MNHVLLPPLACRFQALGDPNQGLEQENDFTRDESGKGKVADSPVLDGLEDGGDVCAGVADKKLD